MTLDEFVQAISDRTRRIDKLPEIRTAVRTAIKMVHGAAFFPQDIVENEVELYGTYTNFKIPLPPSVRKFILVAPLSSNGSPIALTTKDNTYDYVSASDLIESHFNRKSDIYYVAGAVLSVRSTVGASKLYVSYYTLPDFSDNNLETWIMRQYEGVVIEAALSTFLRSIGKIQHADAAKREMLMQLQPIIDAHVHMEE